MSADQPSEIAKLRQENERLRMERDILKSRSRSLPETRFIEDHRDSYPVRLMCAVLEDSTASYYAWREPRATSNAVLLAEIRQVIARVDSRMAVLGSILSYGRGDAAPAMAGSNG
ncbi:hypothetical protein ACH79_27435 [Bradyrhizobium sp. CCBAU 051011]|nr:hypothetical protein ACH79_27435 [Bradyrhizobium sp. CCBAU 051011]